MNSQDFEIIKKAVLRNDLYAFNYLINRIKLKENQLNNLIDNAKKNSSIYKSLFSCKKILIEEGNITLRLLRLLSDAGAIIKRR